MNLMICMMRLCVAIDCVRMVITAVVIFVQTIKIELLFTPLQGNLVWGLGTYFTLVLPEI